MYAIIRNNLVIGTTDELNYIKLQDNGCYGQDKSSNPKGIAFMSVAYNILGTNGIGCPESVEIREVDEETLKQLPKFDYLGEAMDKKCTELSAICNKTIVDGIDYNGKHYSLTAADQTNIDSMFNSIVLGANSFPYHADGEECAVMDAKSITELYMAYKTHVTYHTTYFNMLKAQMKTYTEPNKVYGVQYGEELNDTFKAKMNEMLAAAQEQMNNIANKLDGASNVSK